ncbi:MAG: 23S rRNA (guanosine(2251)-2'-O)-methyltransferase RlmB [Chitinophagaceae bacterium]
MSSFKNRLIIGRQPLVEAIESGKTIDKILLQKNANGETASIIKTLCKEHQIPMQFVPVEKLNSFTKANHQGVIAFAALVSYLPLQTIIDFTVEKGEAPLFLMLDGVTDVRNIGAIARTALCCGAQAIIIADKGVGALNEETMKSSAGALEHIHICRVGSLMKAIDELHLNGIKVVASEMKAEKKLYDLELKEPCCVVMGGEENGVYPAVMKICDEVFHIPMAGKFESLNVSVATGMILYEAMKQRC